MRCVAAHGYFSCHWTASGKLRRWTTATSFAHSVVEAAPQRNLRCSRSRRRQRGRLAFTEARSVGHLRIVVAKSSASRDPMASVCNCSVPQRGSALPIVRHTSVSYRRLRTDVPWVSLLFYLFLPGSRAKTTGNKEARRLVPAWRARSL